jgi:hypothetical protein
MNANTSRLTFFYQVKSETLSAILRTFNPRVVPELLTFSGATSIEPAWPIHSALAAGEAAWFCGYPVILQITARL